MRDQTKTMAHVHRLVFLRIATALVLLVQVFWLKGDLTLLYSSQGWVQGQLNDFFLGPYTPRLAYHRESNRWVAVDLTNAPHYIPAGASSVWTGSQLLIWGGYHRDAAGVDRYLNRAIRFQFSGYTP